MKEDNKYTLMQKKYYDEEAKKWSISNPDPVVGSFNAHNNCEHYGILFQGIDTHNKIALDFACGPGRNIVKFNGIFSRIDGVDISEINIENAKKYISESGISNFILYTCNGIDLSNIESNIYDIIFSTIALQHICVHEIRYNYFKEFYRVLKPGGIISIQMGYGSPSPMTVGYYENFYDALGTNRACDVCISSPDQVQKDLIEIGFMNFSYEITGPGPGDGHPKWIFFKAKK